MQRNSLRHIRLTLETMFRSKRILCHSIIFTQFNQNRNNVTLLMNAGHAFDDIPCFYGINTKNTKYLTRKAYIYTFASLAYMKLN